MNLNKDDIFVALILIAMVIGMVLLMIYLVVPSITKTTKEQQYEESWECVEWSTSMFGTTSKDELYGIKNFIATELARCNYTYDCLWEDGFIENGSRISLVHYLHNNEWRWHMYTINETTFEVETIESIDLTDDNCTKQIKVRVKHES